MSDPDPTRDRPPRMTILPSDEYACASHARDAWHAQWAAKASAQGWCLFDDGSSLQVQKLDCPDDWLDEAGNPAPEWDTDAVAWGMVYHGSDPVHVATREFLKQYAPAEWAFITEHINATTDPEGTLHPSAGPTDGG